MIINPTMYSGSSLPELDNPGTAADLLAGKQLVDQYGNPLTGIMLQKSASDLTANGASVTVPAGYYPEQVSKSVAETTQATPTITVSSAGLITAKHTQTAGYVVAGTKSATKQLTTQASTTITPGTSRKTAVSSGTYTTGAVYVAGDTNLKAENIKSGVSIFGVTGNLQAQEIVSLTFNVSSTIGLSGLMWACKSNNGDLNFWSVGIGKKEHILKKGEMIVLYYIDKYNYSFTFSNNVMVGDLIEGATDMRNNKDYFYFLAVNGDSTITVKIS